MLGWECLSGLELHNLGCILHIWGFGFCSAHFFSNLEETHEAEARKRGKKIFYFSLISSLTQWALELHDERSGAGRDGGGVWSRDTWGCRNCSFLAVDVSMQNQNVCIALSSEVLLPRDVPEGSCKHTWVLFV